MSDTKDFDLEQMLYILNPVIEAYAEGSKEREALMRAQAALLYIHKDGKDAEFAKRYEWGQQTSFTIEVSHEFATREEADRWLARGTARHKERVKIAGKGFMVVQLPGRQTFISNPHLEELNSDEWAGEPE